MVGANLINKCRFLAQPDVDIFLCILKQHGTSRLFWVFGTATIGVVGGMQIHDFGVRNIEMEAAQFAAFTHSLDIRSCILCAYSPPAHAHLFLLCFVCLFFGPKKCLV